MNAACMYVVNVAPQCPQILFLEVIKVNRAQPKLILSWFETIHDVSMTTTTGQC